MSERIEGTPFVAEGDWDSEWQVKAPSLEELKRLLGLPLLIEFCRCSVTADRLLGLGDFALFNDERRPRLEIAHARNLQTMFWLVCGTLHEAIDSLTEMEQLGIEGLLGSVEAQKPWHELRGLAARWNKDPMFQRVRNKVAFHVDASAVRKGINKSERQGEPVVWKTGNTRKERSTLFRFAQDCLLSVLLEEESEQIVQERFQAFSQRVRDAHLGFSAWTQELFIAAVRGAVLGLKLTPTPRPMPVALTRERLEEIGQLGQGCEDAALKEGVGILVNEVTRLTGILRRSESDPGLADARQRQAAEERRLRAIAATAREYLISRAPGADLRLRDLLHLPAPPDVSI